MSNYLKASEYQQSSKHELVPQNVYDTVSGTEVLASQSTVTELTDSVSISSSDISSTSWTKKVSQKNIGHWGAFNTGQAMAKSLVAVKTKEFTITLKSVSQTISSRDCSATAKLKGEQWNASYDDAAYSLSDIDTLEGADEWSDWSDADKIVTEIKTSAYKGDSWESDSAYVNYSNGRVPLYGFLKDGVEYLSDVQFSSSRNSSGTLVYSPTWDDKVVTDKMPATDLVITKWMPLSADYTSIITYANFHCKDSDWEYNGSKISGGTLPTVGTKWLCRADLVYEADNPYSAMITYDPQFETFSFWYEQVNEYTIKVHFTIPIAYVYAAASAYTTQTYVGILYKHNCDSTLFYNEITSAEITLTCGQQGTDSQEFSYSLDANENLTESVTNVNILNLSGNELITDQAYRDLGDELTSTWKEAVSSAVLKEYKNGKTTFECKVPAEIGYSKGFKINDLYYIKKQDGSSIVRGYKAAPFVLKNITKTFEQGSFVWTLKFLEGPVSQRLNEQGSSQLIYWLNTSKWSSVATEKVSNSSDATYLVPYAMHTSSIYFYEGLNADSDHFKFVCTKQSDGSYNLQFYDTLLYNATLDDSYEPIWWLDGVILVNYYNISSAKDSTHAWGIVTVNVYLADDYVKYWIEGRPQGIFWLRVKRASPFNVNYTSDYLTKTNLYGASLFGVCLQLPQLTYEEGSAQSIEVANQTMFYPSLNSFDPNKQKISLVMLVAFSTALSLSQRVVLNLYALSLTWTLRNSGGQKISTRTYGHGIVYTGGYTAAKFYVTYKITEEDLKTGIIPTFVNLPSTWSSIITKVHCRVYLFDSAELTGPKELFS